MPLAGDGGGGARHADLPGKGGLNVGAAQTQAGWPDTFRCCGTDQYFPDNPDFVTPQGTVTSWYKRAAARNRGY
eukprot:497022-Lingulodinium_polyedra.AAC.1